MPKLARLGAWKENYTDTTEQGLDHRPPPEGNQWRQGRTWMGGQTQENWRFAAVKPINQSLKHYHPNSFMWAHKFPYLFQPVFVVFLYHLLVTRRFLIGTLTQKRSARYCEPNGRRIFLVSVTLEIRLEQWYSRILRVLRRCLWGHIGDVGGKDTARFSTLLIYTF